MTTPFEFSGYVNQDEACFLLGITPDQFEATGLEAATTPVWKKSDVLQWGKIAGYIGTGEGTTAGSQQINVVRAANPRYAHNMITGTREVGFVVEADTGEMFVLFASKEVADIMTGAA